MQEKPVTTEMESSATDALVAPSILDILESKSRASQFALTHTTAATVLGRLARAETTEITCPSMADLQPVRCTQGGLEQALTLMYALRFEGMDLISTTMHVTTAILFTKMGEPLTALFTLALSEEEGELALGTIDLKFC